MVVRIHVHVLYSPNSPKSQAHTAYRKSSHATLAVTNCAQPRMTRFYILPLPLPPSFPPIIITPHIQSCLHVQPSHKSMSPLTTTASIQCIHVHHTILHMYTHVLLYIHVYIACLHHVFLFVLRVYTVVYML